MLKKWLRTLPLLGIMAFLTACQTESSGDPLVDEMVDEKINVVASFYPLYEFSQKVAGDRAEVIRVIPEDTEPHEYEPTPRQIEEIYRADLFIFNGFGLDPWAERLQKDLESKGIHVLPMASKMGLTSNDDPHFWLDPVLAGHEVELIRDALIAIDPDGRQTYQANAAAALKELQVLDRDFKMGLQSCPTREIVVSHDAYSYLAQRYNLTLFPIAGISPEEEPSPRQLADLVQTVQQKNIKVIFFETLASPRLAETLSRETGAELLVLNPLEGRTAAEVQSGATYFSLMQKNLNEIRMALQCP